MKTGKSVDFPPVMYLRRFCIRNFYFFLSSGLRLVLGKFCLNGVLRWAKYRWHISGLGCCYLVPCLEWRARTQGFIVVTSKEWGSWSAGSVFAQWQSKRYITPCTYAADTSEGVNRSTSKKRIADDSTHQSLTREWNVRTGKLESSLKGCMACALNFMTPNWDLFINREIFQFDWKDMIVMEWPLSLESSLVKEI